MQFNNTFFLPMIYCLAVHCSCGAKLFGFGSTNVAINLYFGGAKNSNIVFYHHQF